RTQKNRSVGRRSGFQHYRLRFLIYKPDIKILFVIPFGKAAYQPLPYKAYIHYFFKQINYLTESMTQTFAQITYELLT
ncbi:MAG: hypothetical protein ACPG5L_17660, partial [Vibrio gallaecicus]